MRSLIKLWFLLFAYPILGQQHLQFDQFKTPFTASGLLQDEQGFIWFATNTGLVRYDGYEFKSFPADTEDSTAYQGGSFSSDILEDYQGSLWIGTWNGRIYRFNPKTEKFKYYDPDSNDSTAHQGQRIYSILQDSSNRLWISAFDGGLNLYIPEKDRFKNFFQQTDSNNFWINNIRHIYEASPGHLWLEADGGLFEFNASTESFTFLQKKYPIYGFKDGNNQIWAGGQDLQKYNVDSAKFYPVTIENQSKLPSFVAPVAEIEDGRLLVKSNDGLGIYDAKNIIFYLNKHEPDNPYSVAPEGISDLIIDHSGMYWALQPNWGTVNVYNPHKPVLHFLNYLPDKKLESDMITYAIHIDDSSNIWIGTRFEGLIKYNPQKQRSISYQFESNIFKNAWITGIFQDKYGILWLGSWKSGLFKFDPATGEWENYEPRPIEGIEWFGNQILDRINNIFEDSHNNLWVGTSGSNLNKLKLSEEVGFKREVVAIQHISHETTDDRSLSNFIVNDIHEDQNADLWVATSRGLNKYNPESNDFDRYLIKYTIGSLFTDSKKQFWVGTTLGLFKTYGLVDGSSKDSIRFEKVEVAEDLKGQPIFVGGEDNSGNLWAASSGQRIVRFSPNTNEYKIFDQEDGVRMGELLKGTFSSNGILGLCGSNGFVTLNTNEVKSNPYKPSVVITDFQLSNRSFTPKDSLFGKPVLSNTINYTNKITLPYGQNFTFKFSALNFANPSKNQYSYQLEGFDDDWSPPSTNRTATYTNLWEDDYTFRVRGSNNDGVWNQEGTSVQITILPPWYRSKLAWVIYGGLLVFALVWARKLVVQREREKAKHQLKDLELEKAKEMDTMKTQFFANVSHEFRTPLTLILGPLKQMKEGTFKGDADSVINVMIRNSKRLLHLINQLLDFSKLEAGAVGLQASVGDLVEFVRTMFASFETTAQTRDINYIFQSNVSSVPAYYDRDKLEKVIINLLSNAFKFTPKGGSIKLTMSNRVQDPEIDKGEGIIEIRIEDSGKGIDPQKLPHIFDRFYQADASSTRQQEGTGIGLALAKELVELHHGCINASSHIGLGTAFTIHLPLGRAHLKDEEIVVRKGYQSIDTTALETLHEEVTVPLSTAPENGDIPLLLIIDDNEDMRLYLREVLSDTYRIEEAHNGVKGWDQAIEHIPNLIISDVMMPEMDGQELCQKLKSDERTSHIPVVLLTARAGEEAKVEGLETGADDYVTKPFSPVELKARVHNLIELRQKLREQFSKNLSLEPKDIAVTSADERFLQRAMDILEIHRSDAGFNADSFTKEIGFSRSQLHRKLKALTDQSTGEFIRSYRLKYARQLIEKEYGNMAQVAYECGFNNPSYFAEQFKKQFGMLPSEFAKSTNA